MLLSLQQSTSNLTELTSRYQPMQTSTSLIQLQTPPLSHLLLEWQVIISMIIMPGYVNCLVSIINCYLQQGDMVVAPLITAQNGKEYIRGKALALRYVHNYIMLSTYYGFKFIITIIIIHFCVSICLILQVIYITVHN